MKWRVVLLLSFLAMLGVLPDSAKEKSTQETGVLRVETRLVELSVVAQDSSGRAVTGLSRNDFTLYDNGKPVPIDEFSSVSLRRAPAETLPPNTFSNRVGSQPIITVVLLDGLNTSFQDQSWARTEVVRFLKELRPEDRVGIMLLGEHLYVLQNFTSNPQLLLAALRNAPVRNPREVAGSAPPQSNPDEADQASVNVLGSGSASSVDPSVQGGATTNSALAPSASSGAAGAGASIGFAAAAAAMAQMQAIMNQFQGHESAHFQVDSVKRTLDALMAIANYLAHFPGRKNLIWVSSSFPISIGFDTARQPGDTRDQIHFSSDFENSYKHFRAALNNANMAIYPVDARGLVAGAPGTTNWNNLYSSQDTMKELASATGGQAFVNTNDIALAMRAAADDSLASYELGFYLHDIKWNGQEHTLKVKVSRPGVHLRYRQGYFAAKKTAPKTPKNVDQADNQFSEAIQSPLDSPGVGLKVTLEKVTHVSDTRQVMGTNKVVPYRKDRALLGINVDAHDIALHSGSSGGSVQLALVLAQTAADGKVLGASRYDMKMRVTASGMQRFLAHGLRMEKWVDLVQGATSLELVVRDPNSGDLGSIRIPVGGV